MDPLVKVVRNPRLAAHLRATRTRFKIAHKYAPPRDLRMAELFDIDRFMDASGKVDLSDIDWSEVPKYPMTPEALRTLRYFMHTEGSTFFYVKQLMKTKAAILEPDLAPFLCVWMYEEEFHGRAFRKFMEAYGEKVPDDYRTTMFLNRGAGERIDEISQTVLSHVFPVGWPAVHMIWGVVQEWTTYNGYIALVERTGHPILATICQRIMKQEIKHYAFYRDQAYKRLVNDPASQKLTSWALKTGWTPVGDGMSSKEDVNHAIQFLFDGQDGDAVDKVDRKMREMPGLEWFDLFRKFTVKQGIGRAPDSWFPRPRSEFSKSVVAATARPRAPAPAARATKAA